MFEKSNTRLKPGSDSWGAVPRSFPRSVPQAYFTVLREGQAFPKDHLDHGLSQPLQGKRDNAPLKAVSSSVSGMIG